MRHQSKNLLSKTAIQALQLLKPDSVVHNMEKTPNFRKEFPELFTGLGVLKEPYKIPLKDDAIPVCIYTPRRVPHPLLPKVKSQFEKNGEDERHFESDTTDRMVCRNGAGAKAIRRSTYMR